jgi:hypothetical protein
MKLKTYSNYVNTGKEVSPNSSPEKCGTVQLIFLKTGGMEGVALYSGK